jgi:hypothetical protein
MRREGSARGLRCDKVRYHGTAESSDSGDEGSINCLENMRSEAGKGGSKSLEMQKATEPIIRKQNVFFWLRW